MKRRRETEIIMWSEVKRRKRKKQLTGLNRQAKALVCVCAIGGRWSFLETPQHTTTQ